MAATEENRQHARLVHHAQVLVTYSDGRVEKLEMHDFSESGMFILCLQEKLPEIGDVMQIQTLEIEDAPVLDVNVIRKVQGKGFAVKFL